MQVKHGRFVVNSNYNTKSTKQIQAVFTARTEDRQSPCESDALRNKQKYREEECPNYLITDC